VLRNAVWAPICEMNVAYLSLRCPGTLSKAAQGGLDKSGEVAPMGVESVLEKDELSKRLAPILGGGQGL
jgi:hypothetical protein